MQIYVGLNYADHRWDYGTISALGLMLSGLRSVVFNHFHLQVRHSVQDSGHDQLPSANPELVEQWKCVDAALAHHDFSNLTNFTIEWWYPPRKEYKTLVPKLFQELLPQFSSRVTTTAVIYPDDNEESDGDESDDEESDDEF